MSASNDRPPPAFPATYPNPQINTLKASAVSVEVDGGAFVISLSDLRAIQEHRHIDRFADGKSGFVEIGRYCLAPIAFLYLLDAVKSAEQYYLSHFGPLPDREKLMQQIQDEAPERRLETEARMGFRQPSDQL